MPKKIQQQVTDLNWHLKELFPGIQNNFDWNRKTWGPEQCSENAEQNGLTDETYTK
jgi:hypothetical protein